MESRKPRGRITVSVIKRSDRKNLVLKIRYPDERVKHRTAGTNRRREAERVAGKLQAELNEDQYSADKFGERPTWQEFKLRYQDEHLATISARSRESFDTAAGWLEELCNTQYLEDVTTSMLSKLASELRKRGRSEQSAKTYVARIQAAINWGHTVGIIRRPILLRLNLVDRSQQPRPLTVEEFERMLEVTPQLVGNEHAASWQYLMRGLWLSGLRLSESINLCWDDEDHICVKNLHRASPMLQIPADRQKGRRAQLYPITPDFARLLKETSKDQRVGPVFRPHLARCGETRSRKTIGDTIAELGRRARIVVSREKGKTRFATAKHFRHSFGARWAPHVSEITLATLMRHQHIETTRKYYVGIAADQTSQKVQSVWAKEFQSTSSFSDHLRCAKK